jgi:hypothetical protein
MPQMKFVIQFRSPLLMPFPYSTLRGPLGAGFFRLERRAIAADSQPLEFLDGQHYDNWTPMLVNDDGSDLARSIRRPKPYLASFADMLCMVLPSSESTSFLAILAFLSTSVSRAFAPPRLIAQRCSRASSVHRPREQRNVLGGVEIFFS